MNRKSISASFNAEEIEGIDRVCEKLGITRGQLLKDAVTFWLIEKPLDDLRHNHPEAYEAILVKKGKITEGTSSNIWIIKKNKLYTHPSNTDILKGVTRETSENL